MNRLFLGAAFIPIGIFLAGCDSNADPVFRVVIESAAIMQAPTDGPPSWCSDGSVPQVSVTARTRAGSGTTANQATLSPVWNQGVVTAARSELESGLRVDVVGQCPSGVVHIGAARLFSGETAFDGRQLRVESYGKTFEVRLHFQQLELVAETGNGGDYGGGDYEYDGGIYVDASSYGDGSADYTSDPMECDASGDCTDTSSPPDAASDTSNGDGSSDDSSDSSDNSSGDDSSGDDSSGGDSSADDSW